MPLLTIREPKESSLPLPWTCGCCFPCSQVQPSAGIRADSKRGTHCRHSWSQITGAGREQYLYRCTPEHKYLHRAGATASFSLVSPSGSLGFSLLVECAHHSLTHLSKCSCLQVSSRCPKHRGLRGFWLDPKPFIQPLGHLLSLPTFWIPTCWLVQLEFYQ